VATLALPPANRRIRRERRRLDRRDRSDAGLHEPGHLGGDRLTRDSLLPEKARLRGPVTLRREAQLRFSTRRSALPQAAISPLLRHAFPGSVPRPSTRRIPAAPAEQVVYPGKQHGFDFADNDPTTADALRHLVQFFRAHLSPDRT
jgi:hypothetical protein